MPRLPTSLLRRARHIHPLLPSLLRPCRDLESAQNELRWLREHAINTSPGEAKRGRGRWQYKLERFCRERERGRPLQYILGSQPYGSLEILCRPKVLIPRPETESITTLLASLLPRLFDGHPRSAPQRLSILDLCTGTGCITYLLHSLLCQRIWDLRLCGVDISNNAIDLASRNLEHNIRLGHLDPIARQQIQRCQDDIFIESDNPWRNPQWDVVISNPPYLSPTAFNRSTSRSARNFEDKIALVPSQRPASTTHEPADENTLGDMFYPRMLHIAQDVEARIFLAEVADMEQAMRVVKMAMQSGVWSGCEIWRDWHDAGGAKNSESMQILGRKIRVRGEGHGRAVLAWRRDGDRILDRL